MNFRTPKIFINILFGTAELSKNPGKAATALLFRHLLLSHINDDIYPAKLAGFGISVTTPLAGVHIRLNGYSYRDGFLKLFKILLAGKMLEGIAVKCQQANVWVNDMLVV